MYYYKVYFNSKNNFGVSTPALIFCYQSETPLTEAELADIINKYLTRQNPDNIVKHAEIEIIKIEEISKEDYELCKNINKAFLSQQ